MRDDNVTAAFKYLAKPQLDLAEDVKKLELFVILMHDSESTCTDINNLRRDLFCSGDPPVSTLPPTSTSLLQQIKRAVYQAGQIWGRAADYCETEILSLIHI